MKFLLLLLNKVTIMNIKTTVSCLLLATFSTNSMALLPNEESVYQGSSFNEVLTILADQNPPTITENSEAVAKELAAYEEGKLPQYKVSSRSFFERIAGKKNNILARDAIRTVSKQEDYFDRVKKLLHPNGTCLSGTWEITEASDYTGYFAQGKKGLMVGRASVTLTNTKEGRNRGFGFAGKIFPTMDANETVKTANFFLIDVLFGTHAKHYLDVSLTSQAKTGFDFFNLFTGLIAAKALFKADHSPQLRPLYPISELGLAENETVVTPKWMMIKADESMTRVDEKDFRAELAVGHYANNLKFDIFVSDTTSKSSKLDQWQRLGKITLDQSASSYGCDRRLHFSHPKIKDSANKVKQNKLLEMMMDEAKQP